MNNIYNDIEQELMNGGFESIEEQIVYLRDIINFCQKHLLKLTLHKMNEMYK